MTELSTTTFAIIKPDAVERGLVGEILSRFERKDFTILEIKKHLITLDEAKILYNIHKSKPFYNGLCEFMTQGYSFPILLQRGDSAIEAGRSVVEQVRVEFASNVQANCVHASDGNEAVGHEYPIFFSAYRSLIFSGRGNGVS